MSGSSQEHFALTRNISQRKNLVIVGSRNYPDFDFVREYLRDVAKLRGVESIRIVSGGAMGVDQVAVAMARVLGFETEVIEAHWERGKHAGMERNNQLVKVADGVTAFWDQQSPGTKDTIKKTLAAGKPIVIYGPYTNRLDPDYLFPLPETTLDLEQGA